MCNHRLPQADPKIFGQNLSLLLKEKDDDIETFCKRLDLEKPRVSRWLDGECFPQIVILIKICNYFEFKDIYALLTQDITSLISVG